MLESVKETRKKRAYHRTSETQKVIFDKAMSLMAEKGFQGTTVREICAQAKIPIGTFYNCYKSKVDILKVVFDEGDKYFSNIEEEFENKSAAEQIRIFSLRYAKLNIATGIEVMRVLYYPMNEWFTRTRPMQEHLLQAIRRGQETGELNTRFSAEQLVRYIFDILRGVCYNWCVYNGEYDLCGRVDEHIDLLCSVIQA